MAPDGEVWRVETGEACGRFYVQGSEVDCAVTSGGGQRVCLGRPEHFEESQWGSRTGSIRERNPPRALQSWSRRCHSLNSRSGTAPRIPHSFTWWVSHASSLLGKLKEARQVPRSHPRLAGWWPAQKGPNTECTRWFRSPAGPAVTLLWAVARACLYPRRSFPLLGKVSQGQPSAGWGLYWLMIKVEP